MGKIISGLLGSLLVTAVVAGTAFAVFTSSATVNGITLTAGSANLEIVTGDEHTIQNWNTGLNLNGLYPGYQNNTTFKLENTSSADIALAVSAQLTNATGWPNLANAVEVAVNTSNDSASTGWHSLAQWNAAPIAFPGPAITQNQTVTYKVYVRIPTTYNSGPLAGKPVGNEIAGQSLSNITFTLTGTQQ